MWPPSDTGGTGKCGLWVFFRQDGRGTNLRRSEEETGGRDLRPLHSAATIQQLSHFRRCPPLPTPFEVCIINPAKLDDIIKATRCIACHSLHLSYLIKWRNRNISFLSQENSIR